MCVRITGEEPKNEADVHSISHDFIYFLDEQQHVESVRDAAAVRKQPQLIPTTPPTEWNDGIWNEFRENEQPGTSNSTQTRHFSILLHYSIPH